MITIYYQDNDIVIVEKPPHILVHPNKSLNNDKFSLMDLVSKQIGTYVYPFHRLDRPVSGIVVFALNKEATTKLSNAWTTDLVQKKYTALVRGIYTEAGVLDFPLKKPKSSEYQEALTIYKPLENFKDSTLMEVEIKTGRFHQIRRHFARSVNHVLGDRTHGKGKYNNFYRDEFGLERVFLHSSELWVDKEVLGREFKIVSKLPEDLMEVLGKLQTNYRL